jgi:peroxiredoxin
MGLCDLYDLSGEEVKLSDYKGRPLILWFWTTWCPYCRKAIPELNNLYPELKSSGIELFAINVDERKETVERFLQSYPMDFKVLRDTDARCALLYGIIGVPAYIFIDKKGNLRAKEHFFPKGNYKKLLLD